MILFINLEIEVRAVEIGVRSIKWIFQSYLMVENLNHLFVFRTNVFKAGINLVEGESMCSKQFGNHLPIRFQL